jgi:hypothetical protein
MSCKQAGHYDMATDWRFTAPSFGKVVPVVKANSNLADGVTDGLVCGTAGTANLMMADGEIVTDFPLQQGYNPLRVIQVQTGGTAANIWAGYASDV